MDNNMKLDTIVQHPELYQILNARSRNTVKYRQDHRQPQGYQSNSPSDGISPVAEKFSREAERMGTMHFLYTLWTLIKQTIINPNTIHKATKNQRQDLPILVPLWSKQIY